MLAGASESRIDGIFVIICSKNWANTGNLSQNRNFVSPRRTGTTLLIRSIKWVRLFELVSMASDFMLDRTESDIVLDAQAGSTVAFEKLVLRYQNLITSLAFSQTGDLQRSEDIAQQAFLTAWEKREELKDPKRFGGWLRSITKNLTFNSNRKKNLLDRSAQGLEAHLEPIVSDEPQQSMATAEQQKLLWASLKNIPEDYREPLVLFYREEKSVAQVAELMGLSVDAVKQRLSRGRAMLKSEVEQFVEDLLESSKPSASFASAVMIALPTTSATAFKAALQTSSAIGAKTILGKLGLLASGPMLGALGGIVGAAGGIAGGYWGTRNSVKHATSDEEKQLLWKFFWFILLQSLIYTIAIFIVTFMLTGGSVFGWIVSITIVYSGFLIAQIFYLSKKQKALHAIHGKPEYPAEFGGDGNPASLTQFRYSIFGATIGCWTWLIVLSLIKLNWIILTVSLIVMSGHLVWRIFTAHLPQTLADQLRFQATMVVVNVILAGIIIVVAEWVGMTYEPIPNWSMALLVIVVGWLCAMGLWHGANKAEKKIAN